MYFTKVPYSLLSFSLIPQTIDIPSFSSVANFKLLFINLDPTKVRDAFYTRENEIKQIESLIPEIKEKIQPHQETKEKQQHPETKEKSQTHQETKEKQQHYPETKEKSKTHQEITCTYIHQATKEKLQANQASSAPNY